MTIGFCRSKIVSYAPSGAPKASQMSSPCRHHTAHQCSSRAKTGQRFGGCYQRVVQLEVALAQRLHRRSELRKRLLCGRPDVRTVKHPLPRGHRIVGVRRSCRHVRAVHEELGELGRAGGRGRVPAEMRAPAAGGRAMFCRANVRSKVALGRQTHWSMEAEAWSADGASKNARACSMVWAWVAASKPGALARHMKPTSPRA